jgi:predicted nuclease with TOPRIM domain
MPSGPSDGGEEAFEMAKGKKSARGRDDLQAGAKDVGKRLRRFERRLARVRDNEAKWEHQLGRARARGAELEDRMTALQSTDQAGTVESEQDVSVGQQAFCMGERRKVVIAGATAIVLKNGRAAVAGTCPTCGARVVTTARSVVAPVAHG